MKKTLSFEIVNDSAKEFYLYNELYPLSSLNQKIKIDSKVLEDAVKPMLFDLLKELQKIDNNLDINLDNIFLGGGVYKHHSGQIVFNGSFQLQIDDSFMSINEKNVLVSDVLATYLKKALNQEAIGMNYECNNDSIDGMTTFFIENQDVTLQGVTKLYIDIISSNLTNKVNIYMSSLDETNFKTSDITTIDETINLIDKINDMSIDDITTYMETFDKTFSKGIFSENGIIKELNHYMDNLLIIPTTNNKLMVTAFDSSILPDIEAILNEKKLEYSQNLHNFDLLEEDRVILPLDLIELSEKHKIDFGDKFGDVCLLNLFKKLDNEILMEDKNKDKDLSIN